MAKLGAVLETLFKKLKLDITNENLASLIKLDTEIEDAHATAVNTGLLTVEAAKNNPEVAKHIKATALNPVDTLMNEIITDMKLQPGDDFVTETSTYKKIKMLSTLIHDAGKKAAPSGKDPSPDIAEKVKEYEKKLKDLTDAHNTDKTTWESSKVTSGIDTEIKLLLAGKKFNLPEKMSPVQKVNTVMGMLSERLATKGLKWKRSETGELLLVNKEDLPAHNDKHEALTPITFIDAALAEDGLVQINDPENNDPVPGADPIPGKTTPLKGNKAVVDEIDAQIAAL